jgi:hypothetical protein
VSRIKAKRGPAPVIPNENIHSIDNEREAGRQKHDFSAGECCYYRPQCQQRLFSSEKLALTFDDEESKLPNRNGAVSDFGVALATRISKVRFETRARRARKFVRGRKICEIGVGPLLV